MSSRRLSAVLALLMTTACAGPQGAIRGEDQGLMAPKESVAPPPREAAVDLSQLPVVIERPYDVQTIGFTTPTGRPVQLELPLIAKSIGKANEGRLRDGRCINVEGPGFIQRSPKAACGTDDLVFLLMFAIGEVLREYPDTPPVVIGALSRAEGGHLKPHKSHQSGRDVDLGFYAKNGRPLRSFADLPPESIDFEKTFFLISNLLATGRITFIFVNYTLQVHLYNAAKNMGYDEDQLSWIFQYPRGLNAKKGIIRHSKGHKRHYHVRFACPPGDNSCIN